MSYLFCTICLENFKNTDNIVSNSCGHIFHANCLRKWNDLSSYCPHCRRQNPSSHAIYISFGYKNNSDEQGEEPPDNALTVEDRLYLNRFQKNLRVVNSTTREFEMKLLQSEKKVKQLKETLKTHEIASEKTFVELSNNIEVLVRRNSDIVFKLRQLEIENEELRKQLEISVRSAGQISPRKLLRKSLNSTKSATRLSNSDAKSVMLKGLSYAGREMCFVSKVLELAHKMGVSCTELDIEGVTLFNCSRYSQRNISLRVTFESAQLKQQFLRNSHNLKSFKETEKISVE